MTRTGGRIFFLSLLGLLASIVLLVHHVEVQSGLNTKGSFCVINETFDCDAVAKSAYAEFCGVPVASFGMFFYVIWLVMLTHLRSKSDTDNKGAMLLLSSVGVIVSVVMFGLSAFVLQKVCLNCSLLYVVNLAIFVLSLRLIIKTRASISKCVACGLLGVLEFLGSIISHRDESAKKQAQLATRAIALVSLVSIVILCLPNYVILPVLHKLHKADTTLKPETMEVLKTWRAEQEVELSVELDGPFMDYYYGSKDAPNTIVMFTDYQCTFCRFAKQIMKQYVDANEGKVKLVVKNYPLDMECNRKLTRQSHKAACLLAGVVRCAGEAGGVDAFWDEYNKIDTFSGYEPSAELRKCAKNNDTVNAKIRSDIEEGIKLDLSGTPAIYVKNKRLHKISSTYANSLLDAIFAEK